MSKKAIIIRSAEKAQHQQPYLILSYYFLTPIEAPEAEVATHKAFFARRDVMARIYISKQGINGTLSAAVDDAYAYMQWLKARPEFAGIIFKAHEWHCHVFGRLAVKVKKELVAYGEEISIEDQGEHVSPHKWKEMLESDDDKVILDIRNDYEWEIGHFEGAEKPQCLTFRDFKAYAKKLKERINAKNTKVMMYCTGGIRCEFFSSLLKNDGFENVYQLDGGIINYGVQEDSKHWKGKLYVFDDRLQIPIGDDETEVIGKCRHCECPIEVYYNCANMDCNELFLCCPSCLEKFSGCCQESCQKADRVRPFKLVHTPFRRWHTYAETKEEICKNK